MRIEGTYQISPFAPLRGRPVAEGGFVVTADRPRAQRAGTRKAAGLAGIASLLALQGIDDGDAREDGLRRGNQALDLLEELKIAVLEGTGAPARLDRLEALVPDLAETTGDEGLDGVLAELSLRVQVELAKRGR
ncbi:flagellar assembly protein FliX [Lutibaculum baratangense]|uniref:Flagellar trans-acting factor FliX n=1 Tax=Lutibaculum baratangense AMV1 TaxID=631454 RepID=V4RL31_9HYPH|nr:flagellar assembly protein FliX [Lutibaculum baratangense]ESR26771.1 Flagellar trans-acting factor FliX [Lutibaculum baratangense AMV1]